MNLDSVRDVHEVLASRGLAPKKRWGQNFLVDRNVRSAIADLVTAGPGERAWEVGPGLGALSELLLDRGVELVVFEIDHGLVSFLREHFADYENLTVVAGDVVEQWPKHSEASKPPQSVLGNLPYSSAAPIIASFLQSNVATGQFVFMVQEEVAERMIAGPNTRTYSAFTVLVQSRMSVSRKMRIRPGSFYPRPEVSSAVVELHPRAGAPHIEDGAVLSAVARSVFHARRKTIANSMAGSGLQLGGKRITLSRTDVSQLLAAAGVEERVRGESLPVERIVELANHTARRVRAGDLSA